MKGTVFENAIRVVCVVLLFIAAPVFAQLAGVAAEIPKAAFGTWSLQLEDATARSPYRNDTAATLTIAIDGSICSDGFLVRTPFMKAGIPDRIYWNQPDNNLEFSISTTSFDGFRVSSADGIDYGFFRAAEEPSANDCDTNQLFFDLAEARFPQLFPEGVFILTHMTPTEFYRYYSSTDTFLIIRNGQASALGGKFGGVPVQLGTVNTLVSSTLDEVISGLPSNVVPVQLPPSLTGTYRMTFTAAGVFSPIPGGTVVDVAITEESNLCLNGTLYTDPVYDVDDPAIVSWQNPLTGLVVRLNTSTGSATSLSLQLRNLKEDLLGTLNGNKTQLLAQCAGLVAGNLDIAAVNQLFAQAEQYYPGVFPASALTFNQLGGGSLTRYYPATGVLVTIVGDVVQVRGGVYGTDNRTLGKVDALLSRMNSPQAALAVSGSLVFKQGSLPALNRKVERSDTVAMPVTGTTNAELAQLVEQVLASELNGTNTYTFSNVTSTSSMLEFTVRVANTTTVAGTVIQRDYNLLFTYRRL